MNLPESFGSVSQSSKFAKTVRVSAAQLIINSELQATQERLEQERKIAGYRAARSKAETKLTCLKDLILEAYIEPLQAGLPFNVFVRDVVPTDQSCRSEEGPFKGLSQWGGYQMTIDLKGKNSKAPFEIVLTCDTTCDDDKSLSVNLWPGTQERKKRDECDNRRYREMPFVRTGERKITLTNPTDVEALNAPLVAMMPEWLHRLSQIDVAVGESLRSGSWPPVRQNLVGEKQVFIRDWGPIPGGISEP